MIFLVFHIVRMGKLPLLYYFSSFIIFFSGIKLSLAADSISQEDSIKDGDTLLSSEQSFELGFFSPGNSKNRYLGMWYKKSPETVVWVANRNKPVVGANGVLSITDGNLVLVNGTKDIIWSSNVSTKVENPVAELLECGNFVLREKFSRNTSDSYLWQSFDYPSDVLLPSMNLGRNLKTGLDRYLTSWRSTEDPSSGNFTLRFDIRVLPEVVIYRESMIIARTGPWNGLFFAGIPAQQPTSIFGQVVVHTQDEYSFIYESTSGSADMFVKLNQSGWIEWHVWNERKARWTDNYTMPEDICGSYGRCGANTICSINDKSPNCECLEGFIPNSHNNLTSSGGCVRSSQFDCDAGDVFVKLDGIKLPDLIDVSLNESINFEDCKAGCLKHCSCKAYTISNITRGGSGCLMWFGDLIDTRKLPQNRGTQDIYLRVPASERVTNPTARNKGNRSKELIIVILIILSTIVILGLIITYITRNFRRKGEDLLLFDLGMNLDNDSELPEVKGKGGTKEVKLPLFSFASVSAATDSFSDKNKLGEGGFGSVYKGTLLKGGEIAVKRLSTKSGQGWEEFKNEAVLIAKLQHKNLVRVLGCCIEQNEKILIYEYLPNKSLDIVLFDPMQCKLLDWGTRIRIIEGIAQGLLYLHEYSRLRIIHRDLKASNILLDKDMNPKISDFGMARIFGADELQANTNRIVGTFGYMSPEYVLQGIFSNKSDVFSFGVLLLEIISGKKNSRFSQENSQSLLGYAWDSWLNDRGMDLMDPTLEGAPCNDMLLRYINIALLCAQESAEDRPSMSDVVSMLSNESAPLPTPEKPAFTHVRSSPMSNTFISDAGNYAVNQITISVSGAR